MTAVIALYDANLSGNPPFSIVKRITCVTFLVAGSSYFEIEKAEINLWNAIDDGLPAVGDGAKVSESENRLKSGPFWAWNRDGVDQEW